MNKELNLESFVDRLYEEKNFPQNLEAEVVKQIKDDLLEQVEDRINALIINNLSEENLEEFNQKIDQEVSDQEMQKFFNENIPDLAQLIAAELIVFKQTYLS